ncbi:MAG: heparinase II/III family protein [Rhodomicrobium sp.]
MNALARAWRSIEFARHIPIAKLARRGELRLRRKIADHLQSAPSQLRAPTPAQAPPLPLFPPRLHLTSLETPGGLVFSFLHRPVTMSGAGIDWTSPGPGPAHQLWRMNLHYMEHLECVSDELWARLATDWISENPQSARDAWVDSWNSYALSLRVVIWLQELARRGAGLPEAVVRQVENSAIAQLRFLERNLETDIGGNHLIKNIKALIWASAFFEGEEAQRWRRKGLGLLSRELSKQILPDGVHDERSASYHAQVFADLLECRHALGEGALGGALENTLRRMAQVVADLAHPDGGPALFNDAGLDMAYGPSDCLDVYERLFGRRPVERKVFAFEAAGYYGLRSGGVYFVADCGRIAPDDLPAHGHGDVLSFELSVGGERMIVDQGVCEYSAGEKRQCARSALSHNTFCFAGADQADFFGAFRCGRRPNVTVLAYEPGATGFVLEGTHDGFCHLPGKPRHVRRFEASPDRILIRDRIEGTPDRAASIGFLLHPDARATVEGNTATVQHGAGVIGMACSAPIGIEPAVWWPCMGLERTTSRLIVRLQPSVKSVVTDIRIVQ